MTPEQETAWEALSNAQRQYLVWKGLRLARMVEARGVGLSLAQVGTALGMSKQGVDQLLKRQ